MGCSTSSSSSADVKGGGEDGFDNLAKPNTQQNNNNSNNNNNNNNNNNANDTHTNKYRANNDNASSSSSSSVAALALSGPILHSSLVFSVVPSPAPSFSPFTSSSASSVSIDPHTFISSGDDGVIHQYRMGDARAARTWTGHAKAVNALAVDEKRRRVYSCSRDLSVRVWALDGDIGEDDHDGGGGGGGRSRSSSSSSSNNNNNNNSTSIICSGYRGKLLHTLRDAHSLSVSALSLSSDGATLATGSRDYSIRFWDINAIMSESESRSGSGSGSVTTNASTSRVGRACQVVYQNVVTSLRWVPVDNGSDDSNLVVQSSEDLQLRIWDRRITASSSASSALSWRDSTTHFALHVAASHCGTYLATSYNGFEGDGCMVKIWDRRKPGAQCCLREMYGHSHAVSSVEFVPGSTECVVTGSKDHTVRLWDSRRDEHDDTNSSYSTPSAANTAAAYVEGAVGITTLAITSLSASTSMVCAGTAAGFLTYFELDHEAGQFVLRARTRAEEQ